MKGARIEMEGKLKVFGVMGLGVYMPMARSYKTQLKHSRE